LVEAVVALAVVATGMVAAERLLARSTQTVAAARAVTLAQLTAQSLLAEARLGPLPLGTIEGTDDAGVGFTREVRPTGHPGLREVRVRTRAGANAGGSCELVEVLRVPVVP
jgi:type II secretory pathway pseudopilin PulG